MDIFERLEETKRKINYAENVLAQGGLELWEAKEFSSILSDYYDEIKELHIAIELYKNNY